MKTSGKTMMKTNRTAHAALVVCVAAITCASASELRYPVVDTGQVRCYDDWTEIAYPATGAAFYGQDAHYEGMQPAYRDNGDGTITDLNTGLMWQADPGEKMTYSEAAAGASRCRTGGYRDWRLPTIKELYSLILFSGMDPDPHGQETGGLRPFIDTRYFKFQYGKPEDGDRIIDSQFASCTLYNGKVMNDANAMFGVNFADGRIKGYPVGRTRGQGRGEKTFYVLYVRGNAQYGRNDFVDNGDGTVTDRATGLTWMKIDSAALKAGKDGDGKMDWSEALGWAESLDYDGHDDWRLPNAKELHSILDYSRSPDRTGSAAIAPVLQCTPIVNEGGKRDYAYYWTGTSHTRAGSAGMGVYMAFGRALGYMSDRRSRSGSKTLMDVHGAGAQRSDVKQGDPETLPKGRGPQGDVMRIYNLVRCVRGGDVKSRQSGPAVEMKFSARPVGRPVGEEEGDRREPPAGGFVGRLDRNGDGKVSREEFDGPGNHFTGLDRNHDGYLDESEAPPPPRRGRPPSRR